MFVLKVILFSKMDSEFGKFQYVGIPSKFLAKTNGNKWKIAPISPRLHMAALLNKEK